MKDIVLYEVDFECCGCSACKAICPKEAISMVENSEGFLYPEIDKEKCISCGLCVKVCPLKSEEEKSTDKKRVGILCCSNTENLGANLVAWSLQNKVSEILGNNAEVGIIEYTGREESMGFRAVSEETNIKEIINLGNKFLSDRLDKKKSHLTMTQRTEEQTEERSKRFESFKENYLNILDKTYYTSQFKQIADSLDAIIIGSDIVFQPARVNKFSDVYMLACLKNSHKNQLKMSYAASMSTNDKRYINPIKKLYAEGMERFDYISVREKSSQDYLQSLTDKKVEYCCDPVLLYRAEDFDFADKGSDERYVYLNTLGSAKGTVEFAEKIAKEKQIGIKFFTDSNYLSGDGVEDVYSDGPLEFISRIKNADYVITTSFHSVVLSIIFHKKFFVFFRKGQNLKLVDLLTTLGLKDRTISGGFNSINAGRKA